MQSLQELHMHAPGNNKKRSLKVEISQKKAAATENHPDQSHETIIPSEKTEHEKAMLAIRRFISHRERSRFEVRMQLKSKGFNEEIQNSVIAELTQSGFLDEERFARLRAEHRAAEKGPLFIRQELHSLGISNAVIETVLAELDNIFFNTCYFVTEKKWKECFHEKDATLKIQKYLYQKGFTTNYINESLKTLKEKYPLWAKNKRNEVESDE